MADPRPQDRPQTLGELRSAGYQVLTVRDEMRRNLMRKLADGSDVFPDRKSVV